MAGLDELLNAMRNAPGLSFAGGRDRSQAILDPQSWLEYKQSERDRKSALSPLEGLLEQYFGEPAVAEGSRSFRAPYTRDDGSIPDPGVLLPPLRPGENVYGMDIANMLRNKIDPVNPNPSKTKREIDSYQPGLQQPLRNALEPRISAEIEQMPLRDVVHGLMSAGWSPEQIDKARVESSDPGNPFRGDYEARLRGLLTQSRLSSLIGSYFSGEKL